MSRKESLRFFSDIGGKQLVDDIHAYERTLRRYDKQFKVNKRGSSSWIAPGAVQQVVQYNSGVRLRCQNGWIEAHWIAVDCLRIRLRYKDNNFPTPFSYAVSKADWPTVSFEVTDNSSLLEIRSTALVCHVDKRTSNIRFETNDGRWLCGDRQGMQWRGDGRIRLSLQLQPDEVCYGTGERASGLNLRGKQVSLWNIDPRTYERGSDPLYYNIPFYLGVHNQGLYGIFWDNSSRGSIDLGASKVDELAFEGETGDLCYYVFYGDDVKHVLGRYTELTGRIHLPPLWALGYHQGRFSYDTEETVLTVAKEFRNRGIPCDSLYLDIHYMSQFRPFTWNRERFPNFQAMIEDLHNQGFKVVALVDPGIKAEANDSICRSGFEQDVFLKYPDGNPTIGVVWPGICYFPDFSNPITRAWWGQHLNALIEAGVDGIWCDMNEPAVFTSEGADTLPDYVVHNREGLGGDHIENHNVYGMLMGQAGYDGLKQLRPQKRPFNIVRAGYAGSQRYASSWTGDNNADWDHLRLSISMTLNMGLSGAPMTGPNSGGFTGDGNGELLTRWLQASCFLPYFFAHTMFDTHPQEPWSFGQPYEVINRLTIQLRYKFLPYIYSVVAQCKEYGWPIVRPIFMAEPDNPVLRGIDDCYLVGDALLVAPVLEAGAVRRSVYLPVGQWYDYWTNELYDGGQKVSVPAPLERLPLFVKAGTVIPMWPEQFFAQEKSVDTLTYRVYPGDYETIQYEDSGEGFDYESGDYRWIYITCGWDEGHFFINRRIAGRFTPSYKAIKLEIVGFDEEPVHVRVDRQGAPLWFYDAGLIELNVENFQHIEVIRRPLPSDRTLLRRPW